MAAAVRLEPIDAQGVTAAPPAAQELCLQMCPPDEISGRIELSFSVDLHFAGGRYLQPIFSNGLRAQKAHRLPTPALNIPGSKQLANALGAGHFDQPEPGCGDGVVHQLPDPHDAVESELLTKVTVKVRLGGHDSLVATIVSTLSNFAH